MNDRRASSPTVTPGLLYHDAPSAIEWLCRVLGFAQRLVVPDANGRIVHAHVTFGNGGVMLSSAEAYACRDPEGHVWAFASYDAWAE